MSASAGACRHVEVDCLNQYELVRKYRCHSCAAVMMCACDESRGNRFLAHQLDAGVELETQRRVPVTQGFQPKTCPECRGLPPVNASKAETYGSTSKIQRYYWRELFFMTEERVADLMSEQEGYDEVEVRRRIEKEVLVELQHLHKTRPKYVYTDLSQDEIIKRYGVEVVRMDATYLPKGEKGRVIDDGEGGCSAEEFVLRRYADDGWQSLRLESAPFHVLFGVFLWPILQDAGDQNVREGMFGERAAYDESRAIVLMGTGLPEDFGTKSYAPRRAAAVEAHFAALPNDQLGMLRLFDKWLTPSEGLRQYLWAYEPDDIERARHLIEILPPSVIASSLRYLLDDYWRHYCGWPDLLLHRDEGDYFLAEVKSSGDKLSEDQKRWIGDNHDRLHLPFKLVKVHRQNPKVRVADARR
ncbi:MAG: VRR-NUC domain-containing protein [Hyphomonadaceae bacterium]|nr:VRR-NUC domain-containing protein [Hyphomonadaceae bacterium]